VYSADILSNIVKPFSVCITHCPVWMQQSLPQNSIETIALPLYVSTSIKFGIHCN